MARVYRAHTRKGNSECVEGCSQVQVYGLRKAPKPRKGLPERIRGNNAHTHTGPMIVSFPPVRLKTSEFTEQWVEHSEVLSSGKQ